MEVVESVAAKEDGRKREPAGRAGPKTRALVLAAGHGARLRPISEKTPKPLVPLIARPMIEHAFKALSAAGIEDLAVNAHHRPEAMSAALRGGSVFGQRVTLSLESPRLLGTGGAIKRLKPFLSVSDPFVVCNGDTLSRPDIEAAIRAHDDSGALATMVLIRDPRATRFGAVAVDREGAVVDIAGRLGVGGVEEGLFIGTHVISPEIFSFMPEEDTFCVNLHVYLPLIRRSPGRVRAVFCETPFFDLGTPEDFLGAHARLLRTTPCPFPHAFFGLVEKPQGVFVSPGARLHPKARLVGPCAVCEDAVVEAGAVVGPEAVVGAKARVGAKACVERTVLLPEAWLGKGEDAKGLIVGGGFTLR